MSGLPTPPMEDHKSYQSRKVSKPSKPVNRSSKRSNSSHEHTSVVIDGRHKRVWKACERCRMKKTKCDGESPCKRCKDDGLVCTAGSRKKTEFKQLPRGYAEVLENTQYALIATVQKLYTMVRNGESWDLGEPEMNDRGQPVIHDIASKLGCIRPSPDLPNNFPEGAEDFAELQAQLQAARSEMSSEDTGSRKYSGDSSYSPALDRTDRASSSESDHSDLSKEYSQVWSQQRQAAKVTPHAIKPAPLNLPLKTSFDEETNTSPFAQWSGQDDFLGPAHALDLTAHYMRAQQIQGMPRPSPLGRQGLDADLLKAMQLNDGLNFADGTIRPTMLDCNTGFDISDQMDSIIYTGDYEGQIGMA
ncbi:hypothetical protein BGZ57DRAFT_941307 [Hyaloscypha finlandica]|nr:hypothetical protein BGZ57DRAFT_941307 [Hyaloscypha finlandica]